MRCPYCKEEIGEGKRYCPKCGKELTILRKNKKMGRNILIPMVVAIVVLGIGLGGCFFYLGILGTGDNGGSKKNITAESTEKKDTATQQKEEPTSSSQKTDSDENGEDNDSGEAVYDDYLASLRENRTYESAQYAIIDIDQDGIPELLVYSGWNETLFAYTYRDGEVVQISDCPGLGFGHTLELHYSSKYKALISYSRTSDTHKENFYQLKGTSFSYLFSVGWEDYKAETYTRYYEYEDGNSSQSLGSYIYGGEGYDETSEEENEQKVLAKYNEYAGDIEKIVFYELKEVPVDSSLHEEKIENIKAEYDKIENALDGMRTQETGGTTRYIDETERIRKIIAPAGVYDNSNTPIVAQYKAEFSYKDDELIFAYVTNGEEEYRFYMDGYSCLRYIDADGNVQDYEDGVDASDISDVGVFCTLGMLELHWAYE